MSKTRWLEMKEQLKEQLTVLEASEQTHRYDMERLDGIQELELSDEQQQDPSRVESEHVSVQSQPPKKKRKKVGGHIRFDADADSEDEEKEEADGVCSSSSSKPPTLTVKKQKASGL